MRKVLIVDDEPEIVELLMLILGNGLEFLAAYDGEEALRLARENRPDVVIADVMIPRLDGRRLCERIMSDPATLGTKVILMSTALRLDVSACPPDRLLLKPFDIERAVQLVRELLAAEPEAGG